MILVLIVVVTRSILVGGFVLIVFIAYTNLDFCCSWVDFLVVYMFFFVYNEFFMFFLSFLKNAPNYPQPINKNGK